MISLLVSTALASSFPPVGSPRWERIQERGMYFDFEPFAASPPVEPSEVKDIHVVFSNHLDAGFNVRAWCMHDRAQRCVTRSGGGCGRGKSRHGQPRQWMWGG